jgi:hypothetical protein
MRLPLLPRYYEGAMTSYRPSHRASLPSLGGTTDCTRSVRSAAPQCLRGGQGLSNPVTPSGNVSMEWVGSPTFLSSPRATSPCSSTPDGPSWSGQYDQLGAVPVDTSTRTPIDCLSRLNHTALVLAVYASQDGSPRHHARLASGRWPNSTEWDSIPTGLRRSRSSSAQRKSLWPMRLTPYLWLIEWASCADRMGIECRSFRLAE